MAPLPWVRICRSSCFMQAQTPRRLIAFTPVERLGRLVGGVGGRGLNPGVVERHVQPAERRDGSVHHVSDVVLGRKLATRRVSGDRQR